MTLNYIHIFFHESWTKSCEVREENKRVNDVN